MAELEMEVEMTKPLAMDDHIDDDFIDFDTDMVDQPELVSQHAGDNQDLAEAISNAEVDANADVDVEIGDHLEQDAGDATVREEVELSDIEGTANNMDQTGDGGSHTVEPSHDDAEDGAVAVSQLLEEEDEYAEIAKDSNQDAQDAHDAHDARHAQDTASHTHSSDHEIDYELEEQSEQPGSEGELDLGTGINSVTSGADSAVEDPVANAVSGDPDNDYSEHGGYDDNEKQSDQEEITYEENNDDVSDSAAIRNEPSASRGDFEGANTDNLDEETLAKDEGLGGAVGEFHDEEAEEQTTLEPDEVGNVELDEYNATPEAHDDQQDAADLGQQDPSVSCEDSTAASETEFPAITVQYKGDEFPCFSHSSDGFFTETMILDETMDVVLSSFRNELASEIAQEEELVFQVDELGLEFSESCLQDSLSSVTLRQILEIFDLLVKNQDPDSSRTLYTYLFTKPSASKRLESLIESATAGKGLDEVIHLFESPFAAPASVLEANAADDELEEHLNDYDSPVDEVEGLSQSEKEHDVEYVTEDGVDLDASLLNGSPNSNEGDQNASDADDIEGNAAEPAPEDANATNDEASDAAAVEDDVESNAHEESESNPFINLELDVDAEVDEEVDLEVGSLTNEQNPVNPDITNAGATDTSTTTTLKDDDETASLIADISANAVGTELQDTTKVVGEDDVGEIDWRDAPEADEEIQSPPSVVGKRARGDDEGDVEDEQDVKRRRP